MSDSEEEDPGLEQPQSRAKRSAASTKTRTKPAPAASSRPQSQWVAVLPGTESHTAGGTILTLPHPRTSTRAQFYLDSATKQLYEIVAINDGVPRSWFIGDTVQQDGRLLVASPVDPVLLALPLLKRSAADKMFVPLDALLVDSAYPACAKLEEMAGFESIRHVCDHKGQGELVAYRLNMDKVKTYLRAKVREEEWARHCPASPTSPYKAAKIAEALQGMEGVSVGAQAHSANYVAARNKGKETVSEAQRLRFACGEMGMGLGGDVAAAKHPKFFQGVLSQYLAPELSKILLEDLGLPEITVVEKASAASAAAGQYAGQGPAEDYTKMNTDATMPKKATAKMTAAQKALAKVDKTGMKSIAAMFGAGGGGGGAKPKKAKSEG